MTCRSDYHGGSLHSQELEKLDKRYGLCMPLPILYIYLCSPLELLHWLTLSLKKQNLANNIVSVPAGHQLIMLKSVGKYVEDSSINLHSITRQWIIDDLKDEHDERPTRR